MILGLQKAIPRDNETIFLSALAIYVKVLDGYERLCAPGVNPTEAHDRDVTADSEEEEHKEDISRVTKRAGPSLLSQMTTSLQDRKSTSITFLGSHAMTLTHHTSHHCLLPCSLFLRIFHKTSKQQRHHSSTPQCSHSSLSLSGSASYQDEPLILTTSLPATTLPCTKRSTPSISERSSLSLVAQGLPKWLKHMATGFLCGIRLSRQCSSSLSTEPQNSETMATTSHNSSPHSNHHYIPGSSSTTMWCETVLPSVAISCSPISPGSLTSTSFISRSQVLPQEAIQKDAVRTLVQV